MVTLEQMLTSSVHLGHRVQQWNPKMEVYIYGERNGIHIIDLLQTLTCLKRTCNFLSKSAKANKTVLFVCTKPQFTSVVEKAATHSNSYYITQRWLGGMLTNWVTIKGCIDNLDALTKLEQDGSLERFSKKESLSLMKRKAKLEKYLDGIRTMTRIPDIVVVVGQHKEMNAVRECMKLGIPLVSILDTNSDPTLTDYLVPANDDSISSVTLILNAFSEALNNKNIEKF